MKIEEYLKTLPLSIMSGEDVELRDDTLREIFEFASVGKNDIFYHLGCGNGSSLVVALEEFNVKKAVGIDNNNKKIESAKIILEKKKLSKYLLRCEDVLQTDISDATVILFWFFDEQILEKMKSKFRLNTGCRIITLWGPLPGCLPDKVDFPYILNIAPFKKANELKDQLRAVFGSDCIDFLSAWEFADRYIKAVGSRDGENDRFVTILQSLIIWINAKNLGIACGNDIPQPIKSYMGILKSFFNIEVEHLLQKPA